MITAHSGSDSTPENSLEFIHKALELGVDAIEIDVSKDSNQQLVLFHSENACDAPPGCVLLAGAFSAVKKYESVKINCDLKKPGIEFEVLKLAERNGVGSRIILTGRVDGKLCSSELFSNVEVFLNFEDLLEEEGIDIFALFHRNDKNFKDALEIGAQKCLQYGVNVINCHYGLCTDLFFEVMQKNGLQISAWTVDQEEDIKRLLARGIYNITTNSASKALCIRKNM